MDMTVCSPRGWYDPAAMQKGILDIVLPGGQGFSETYALPDTLNPRQAARLFWKVCKRRKKEFLSGGRLKKLLPLHYRLVVRDHE
jgi:hypothetical protein